MVLMEKLWFTAKFQLIRPDLVSMCIKSLAQLYWVGHTDLGYNVLSSLWHSAGWDLAAGSYYISISLVEETTTDPPNHISLFSVHEDMEDSWSCLDLGSSELFPWTFPWHWCMWERRLGALTKGLTDLSSNLRRKPAQSPSVLLQPLFCPQRWIGHWPTDSRAFSTSSCSMVLVCGEAIVCQFLLISA